MAKKSFIGGEDLIKAIQKDLIDVVYPDLLNRLAAGSKQYLDADLAVKARQLQDVATPKTNEAISRVPPPGSANVSLQFKASKEGSPDGSIKTNAQADAYREVFRVMFDDKLGSKAKLLRLLADTGLT